MQALGIEAVSIEIGAGLFDDEHALTPMEDLVQLGNTQRCKWLA